MRRYWPLMPGLVCLVSPVPSHAETYRCKDGSTVKASFPTTGTAVVSIGGGTYRLKTAMAASGAKYTGGGLTFWEHQGEVSLRGAGRSTTCTAGT